MLEVCRRLAHYSDIDRLQPFITHKLDSVLRNREMVRFRSLKSIYLKSIDLSNTSSNSQYTSAPNPPQQGP